MKRPDLDDVTDVHVKKVHYHCGGVLDPKDNVPEIADRSYPAEIARKAGIDLRQTDTDCALVVTPHPMTLQGQRVLNVQAAALVPGETLATFLERHGVVAGQQWVVSLGGVDVPEKSWKRVRPKHGHLIEARRIPGNDALRFVAFVALAYFTAGIASGAIGGSFLGSMGIAGGTFSAALVAGAVGVAGAMLINRLLGPKRGDFSSPASSTNQSYSLSGGRNRMRPFEPMGLVLGEPYCVPDLAAQPYPFFANGEQYLWQLFHAGLNCASVSNIRVGQTPLTSYQNYSLSYEGFAAGNTGLPLLSNVDTVAGALLDAPTSPGAWVTRTSSPNTCELAVDVEAMVFNVDPSSGAYTSLTCVIEIEYRLVGAPAWSSFYVTPPYSVTVQPHQEYDATVGDWVWVWGYTYTYTPTNIEIRNASTKPVRQTYRRQVPAGQYEVRARKVTANVTSTSQQNTVQWTALKSYQVDNGNYKGQARLGLQMQASGQLNGALDEVNWVSTAKSMPYWDGAAWTTATSRANGLSNPGAQILLLARGIRDQDGKLIAGRGLADSQIDIEALKGFMVWCAAKGFTFDYFLQENMSIGDLMDAIAYAGMGSISEHTGKLGVIWFADDQPVESVMNMATTKVKSFSIDYVTATTADELEFQYFDRDRGNAWKSVRATAPGVATPQNTGRVSLVGITTEAHAAKLMRFAMAQNVYQRKTVAFSMDLEHLTVHRSTVVALSHDLTQWGYGGRVQAAVNAAGTVTLTLDDVVPAVGPAGQTSRYIGLRIPGESQYRIFPVAAFAGSTRTLTLASAWPAGVAVPGDAADNPAWDTVWIYDFKATPGQKLRVVSIEPQGNMGGARVALVPETAEFWIYVWTGAYTPPPNNSLLQGAPVVQKVTVTEQLGRQGSGYYTELTATIDVTGTYDQAEIWGAVDTGTMKLLDTTRNAQLHWRGGISETWLLEVRPFGGVYKGAPFVLSYTVKGLSVPPSDVGAISYALEVGGIRLKWAEIIDPDRAGYEIRVGGTSWESATFVFVAPTAEYLWKMQASGTLVIRIKALDTSKNYSVNAATVNVVVTGPAAPVVSYQLAGQDEIIMWAAPSSGFAVDHYEVGYGTDWADAEANGHVITTTKATYLRRLVDYGGARRWLVRAVDLAGNPGAAGQHDVFITGPGSVTGMRVEVLDNYYLVRWSPPTSGSLPVVDYKVRKGATWATDPATELRNGNSNFYMGFEQSNGTYTTWVVPVDSAGNEGAPVGLPAYINQPPDYVLRADINDDLSGGTKTNMVKEGTSSRWLLPLDPNRTWGQHYSGQGWSTPQAKISAGYPLYGNPSVTTSTYDWQYDYGSTLPATTIRVTPNTTLISGAVAMSVQIFWKLNVGDAWTAGTAGADSALATNFRYVKVVLTFTATAGANMLAFNSMNVKLSMKLRKDTGVGVSAIGGTAINFGYPFLYASCPYVQPQGLDSYGKPYRAAPIYTSVPNPTGASVRVFDSQGTEVAGVSFSWTAEGY